MEEIETEFQNKKKDYYQNNKEKIIELNKYYSLNV